MDDRVLVIVAAGIFLSLAWFIIYRIKKGGYCHRNEWLA
jgi:hypothetical protein